MLKNELAAMITAAIMATKTKMAVPTTNKTGSDQMILRFVMQRLQRC
jgi:hypothetical protein